MYEVKRKIFLELTKTQKSALCNYLRALVKQKCGSRSSPASACDEQDEQGELNDSDVRVLERSDENSTGASSVEAILQKFLEDEKYYLEINSSRFEFLREIINDTKFISDANLYIKECKKYYDYKKSQEPLRQAQREFDKKKRKFLQEVKMSKELPTKKQISYYNSLCKRFGQDKKCLDELSKKDLRDLISEMVNGTNGGK